MKIPSVKDSMGNTIPFEYDRTWEYHPIIIGDKIYSYDPSAPIPPVDTENFGKTVQEVVGKDVITDAMIAEHKEKDTWDQMRAYRNELIKLSDWTQGADVPDTIKLKWQSYRQALRDITKAATTADVVWPTEPS
tara:strand:+ start:183 stop:584 length:402 start_codon:yes stop_codon:yes gene_type:complete